MKRLKSLEQVASQYDAVFCDVWGVLHNGLEAFPEAVSALQRIRSFGVAVILLTNSPRPSPSVIEQISHLGVPNTAYDKVVTSGDVTRELIKAGPRRIYHIGTEPQLMIYAGIDVELVEEGAADIIVCTGLRDESTETPADYTELLERFSKSDVPLICANPDIQIHRGNRLEWCAGAIARDYEAMGGTTLIAGKPHYPVYEAAQTKAEGVLGKKLEKSRILAIGDGLLTDVKGASDYGLDVLFIADGVHRAEYAKEGVIDFQKMRDFIHNHGQKAVAYMEVLS